MHSDPMQHWQLVPTRLAAAEKMGHSKPGRVNDLSTAPGPGMFSLTLSKMPCFPHLQCCC